VKTVGSSGGCRVRLHRMRLVILAMCLVWPWTVVMSRAQAQGSGAETSTDPNVVTLMEEGDAIFSTECAACHGADGAGDVGPALAGSAALASRERVIRILLNGGRNMPPLRATHTDRQVAAVATFIRNAWGNGHGPVLETEVKTIRAEQKAVP
jgi:mono/diheme cytochrome c family protein